MEFRLFTVPREGGREREGEKGTELRVEFN